MIKVGFHLLGVDKATENGINANDVQPCRRVVDNIQLQRMNPVFPLNCLLFASVALQE